MGKQQILMKSMFAKSKSLSISYENLLAGCGVEKLIQQLFLSNEKTDFALADASILGMSHYQKTLIKKISLRYFQREESMKVIYGCVQQCFEHTDMELLVEPLMEAKDEAILMVKVPIESITVEIQLELKPALRGKSYGTRESIQSILGNNQKLNYFRYAMEGEIAEKIYQCIYYMELLPEIEVYNDIYHLLENQLLQGRKTRDCLEKLNTDNVFTKDRLDTFLHYHENKELEERWINYSKKMKSTELAWSKVVEKCNRFIQPIGESLEKNDLFFGDWMPELERFM